MWMCFAFVYLMQNNMKRLQLTTTRVQSEVVYSTCSIGLGYCMVWNIIKLKFFEPMKPWQYHLKIHINFMILIFIKKGCVVVRKIMQQFQILYHIEVFW